MVVQNYCHTGGFNRRKLKRMTVNCPCIIILSHATARKQNIASLTTADLNVYTA